MALPPWISPEHAVTKIEFFLPAGNKRCAFVVGQDNVKKIHLLVANGEVHIEGTNGDVKVYVGVIYTAVLQKMNIVLPK